MATELATAYVSIVPSLKGVQGALAKEFGASSAAIEAAGNDSGKRFGGGLVASAKKFAAPLAAAFAAVKVVDFMGDAITEAREAQKVGALTEQVIKSTGGAANVTAKQVGDLAGALSAKVGVDDELIQTGANLLLTFKNVRNEAGKGNDVFNQATKAAVDLSAAGFGSVDSASKQLGKALNDPLKGIAALGRAGVTFTDDQKKLIEGFVTQGDMLSAQKIILGEVNSQVGGAAEASATAGEKLSVAWGNFKETIGTALLPVIDKAATFIAEKLLPALTDLGPVFGDINDFAQPVVRFFRSLVGGSEESGGKISALRETFTSVWGSIRTTFESAVSIVQSLWQTFGASLLSYIQQAIGPILTTIRGMWDVISGIFATVAALLRGDWSAFWAGLGQIVSGAWAVITGIISLAWEQVKLAFALAGDAIGAIFGGMWAGLKGAAGAAMGFIVGQVQAIPGRILGLLGSFSSAGRSLMQGFIDGLGQAGGFVAKFADGVWQAVKRLINGAIDKINSALEFKISIPAAPDVNVNPPNIPHLYTGGIVKGSRAGTLAVIGDRGHDEAVIPTSGPYAPDWVKNGVGGKAVEQNNYFNAPLDEQAYAEAAFRKLRFAAVGAGR